MNNKFRMLDWVFVSILLVVGCWYLSPENTPVVAYKFMLVSSAGVLGYFLHRALFPYGRPHVYLNPITRLPRDGMGHVMAACMITRAIIVAAAMLAVAMGL